MSLGTPANQDDWARMPATKADLELLKANLKLLEADLGGRIRDVRVEMANMGRDLSKEIDKQSRRLGDEISKLRVAMAWMATGVATVLGGLMTLFEFLS